MMKMVRADHGLPRSGEVNIEDTKKKAKTRKHTPVMAKAIDSQSLIASYFRDNGPPAGQGKI